MPQLGANLFSVRSAARAGLSVSFSGDKVNISRGEKIVAVGKSLVDNLYHLDIEPQLHIIGPTSGAVSYQATLSAGQSLHVWRQRLGHVSLNTIKKMSTENMVDGLTL